MAMKSSADWESLYLQLGQLVSEMPDLRAGITSEANRWLGRASYLVREVGNAADGVLFDSAANHLTSDALRDMHAQTIAATVFRALAIAEARAPSAARGGFVGVG